MKVFKRNLSVFTALTLILSLPLGGVTAVSTAYAAPENYVSSVKQQNPFGTCWGFAAIAAAETSIMSEIGMPVTDGWELDLSEHHLAWFAKQAIPKRTAQSSPTPWTRASTVPDISSFRTMITASAMRRA